MVGLDDVQFKKEFNNLMKVQHKNIIKLVGYCYEIRHKHDKVDGEYILARITERALCFEYLKRGSLSLTGIFLVRCVLLCDHICYFACIKLSDL